MPFFNQPARDPFQLRALSESSQGLLIPLVNSVFVQIHQVPPKTVDLISLAIFQDGNASRDFTLRFVSGATTQDRTVSVSGKQADKTFEIVLEAGAQVFIRKDDVQGNADVLGAVWRVSA